jgi:DNA-binding transcriptional MocR family regulator
MTVFDRAFREGILVAPGTLFSNSARFDHYLRINCGWPITETIETGLRRLGEIANECVAMQRKAA